MKFLDSRFEKLGPKLDRHTDRCYQTHYHIAFCAWLERWKRHRQGQTATKYLHGICNHMSTDVSFVELLKCMDNGPPWRPLVIDITCDMTWYLSDAPREMYW